MTDEFTIRSLVLEAARKLSAISATPRLDAELLLAEVLKCARIKLVSESQQEVSAEQREEYGRLLARRQAHEPVAYITGQREFYGMDFEVSPAVLIPRPETELIVERGLAFLEHREEPLLILDLGTGSGCIAIALAAELRKFGREFQIVGVDSSVTALEVAQRNIERRNLADRVRLQRSNWFSAFKADQDLFDLIVSNPPYIALDDHEVSPETRYEPNQALYAGETGWEVIELLSGKVEFYLKPEGCFICEIGAKQIDLLESSLQGITNFDCSIIDDLAGRSRVLELRLRCAIK